MKPRKIPARAERVYTYNLERLPKEERKPFNGPQTVVNRFGTSRPSNDQDNKTGPDHKKHGSQPKPAQKATSREASHQKDANNFDLIAWGNTDEDTQTFYDKMQEHEIGDPDHETARETTKNPKTHDGETPEKFLNIPVDKHLAAKKDVPDPDEKKVKPKLPDFLEGDQPSHKQEPLA